jgi:hypothetical protein
MSIINCEKNPCLDDWAKMDLYNGYLPLKISNLALKQHQHETRHYPYGKDFYFEEAEKELQDYNCAYTFLKIFVHRIVLWYVF